MTSRIHTLIDHYALTYLEFATEIEVPASSISHLFSGRNKPSLDLILKIKHRFTEVDLDWLLLGIGQPFTNHESPAETPPTHRVETAVQLSIPTISEKDEVNTTSIASNTKHETRSIEKIMILYSDKSFEIYNS